MNYFKDILFRIVFLIYCMISSLSVVSVPQENSYICHSKWKNLLVQILGYDEMYKLTGTGCRQNVG